MEKTDIIRLLEEKLSCIKEYMERTTLLLKEIDREDYEKILSNLSEREKIRKRVSQIDNIIRQRGKNLNFKEGLEDGIKRLIDSIRQGMESIYRMDRECAEILEERIDDIKGDILSIHQKRSAADSYNNILERGYIRLMKEMVY